MNLLLTAVGKAVGATTDVAKYHVKKLSSLRVVWNWILGILFIWSCWYGLTHIKESANTVITVLGGVFTAMMTNYVWSSHLDNAKKNGATKVTGTQSTAPAPNGDDPAASA